MTAGVVFAILGAGAIGAVLRYLTARAFASHKRFPWAVLVVNVVGSALGGTLAGLAHLGTIDANLEIILLTGLCGGLTTFSTLSVETMQNVSLKRMRVAVISVLANLVGGIGVAAATYFGLIALAS
ncbi:CrcB family protein [Salinibacterium sp. UTAS2018]|uniref:fluoride efflux transporter FluC n=1 Tax=unclassified Salinibacterium TaxID=2632331 RepID=UPI0010094B24|nr:MULTISPECIES: CrcB family protein [unclassified Salinibacterium]MBH0008266.1 CrcB family protein [Salinibacterium sp. SWN1162]QAV70417.1 CrcB family protein [Salinibacterium sp. UTAS2018]